MKITTILGSPRLKGNTSQVVIGKYIVPSCSTPDQMGDKAEITAFKMAEDLLEFV
jgi:hypothetical protein